MARERKQLESLAADCSLKIREWIVHFGVIVVGSKGASKGIPLWSMSVLFRKFRDMPAVKRKSTVWLQLCVGSETCC